MQEDELSPVEVFCGTDIEAVMIRDFLKNAGIDAYVWHEIEGIRQIIGAGDGVQVVVSHHDLNKAKEILKEYFNQK